MHKAFKSSLKLQVKDSNLWRIWWFEALKKNILKMILLVKSWLKEMVKMILRKEPSWNLPMNKFIKCQDI